jgi:hypothetical protein
MTKQESKTQKQEQHCCQRRPLRVVRITYMDKFTWVRCTHTHIHTRTTHTQHTQHTHRHHTAKQWNTALFKVLFEEVGFETSFK